MQFVDVIRSFRRHWRLSVLLVLVVAVGLAAFLFIQNGTSGGVSWKASVQLLVPHRDEEGVLPEGVPPRLLQGQESVALGEETTREALEGSGIDAGSHDDVEFEFSGSELGDILTLSATAPTRDAAQAVADSFAEAYVSARRRIVGKGLNDERISARLALDALQSRLAEVEGQLGQVDPGLLASLPDNVAARERGTDGESSAGNDENDPVTSVALPESTPLDTQLLVYERQGLLSEITAARQRFARSSTDAIVPQPFATVVEVFTPSQVSSGPPSPLIPIAVAVAVAALLALGVPVLLDRLDQSIRDGHTAGKALAAPVLSTIPAPASSSTTTLARPGSPPAHAYRTLAAASVATDQLPRAIVVTAPVGTMQDSVAANFAAALADLGLRVALVATHARQSWYGDAPDGSATLPDFLAMAHAGHLNGQARDYLLTTAVDNLRVLPAGATETDALIDGLPPLLRALADAGVDVTVIAGPSILEDPSATILAWSTRSVLWVVEAGEVTEQQAGEAAGRLAMAGASPFGVALVDRKS